MKTNFNLDEIEVAIKDTKYLKELNATNNEIEITNKVLKNNYCSGNAKFYQEDSSDNFKYPFYVGFLEKENMKIIFENSIMLWFPAYYLVGECLSKSLNINDYDEWEGNDMDWENTETERINSMLIIFKKNEFQISNVKISHLNNELIINGKFNKDKIEINIK
ncbi:hypothetical protein OAJ95_02235 [Pelagibacteraceae bacterium]|nr:hypothetical protein [Pelagibacteraceae bacterium]